MELRQYFSCYFFLQKTGEFQYTKVANERHDVYNTEVTIEPTKNNSHIVDELNNLKLDLNGTVPVPNNHVAKSVDDLRVSSVPVKDMELEVIRNKYKDKHESMFVVLDKDTLALKIKAQSIEFDVIPAIPPITVDEIENETPIQAQDDANKDSGDVVAAIETEMDSSTVETETEIESSTVENATADDGERENVENDAQEERENEASCNDNVDSNPETGIGANDQQQMWTEKEIHIRPEDGDRL